MELAWLSYEPRPGSSLDRLFRDEPTRTAERIRHYVERLPRDIQWARLASGGLGVELPLLPGTYAVAASSQTQYGRETTLQVAGPDEETRISLAPAVRLEVRIEGSFDRTSGPLPYRTMVIAHRAGWDERSEIARIHGTSWAAKAARPPARGTPERADADSALIERMTLALARKQAPLIPRDFGWVGADGVCPIEAVEVPRHVTVLFPDLRVAYVAVEGAATGLRGRVEPSDFRRLAVRVRRTDGRAFPGYGVSPAPLAHLRAGVFELGSTRPTDADGVLRLGVLAGEAVGLHPRFDAWTVSAGAGTTVERLATGAYASFAVTTTADTVEPSVEIVAEPYRPDR